MRNLTSRDSDAVKMRLLKIADGMNEVERKQICTGGAGLFMSSRSRVLKGEHWFHGCEESE